MKTPQRTLSVWINANPSFKRFDGRIVNYLSRHYPLAYWEYLQHQDEPSSLELALNLLHDYLKSCSHSVNLIGHGTGGVLGLVYARRYPNQVKSLTLLGVSSNPAFDWQAHYCHLRKFLPCSQEIVLTRMVQMMFGYQNRSNAKSLVNILKQDLNTSPTAHSLYQPERIAPGGVSMPLMVCGSNNDGIVDRPALQRWSSYLKNGDVLWTSPLGHHFFHYFFAMSVSKQIVEFWHQVNREPINVSLEFVDSEETCYPLN